MYPWGHLREDNPYVNDTIRVAEKGNAALFATHGSHYNISSVYNFVGIASGSSIDWTMGDVGIKYSFGFELRDTGEHGFLLPEDQGWDVVTRGSNPWSINSNCGAIELVGLWEANLHSFLAFFHHLVIRQICHQYELKNSMFSCTHLGLVDVLR